MLAPGKTLHTFEGAMTEIVAFHSQKGESIYWDNIKFPRVNQSQISVSLSLIAH